jgi:hypothetical protein
MYGRTIVKVFIFIIIGYSLNASAKTKLNAYECTGCTATQLRSAAVSRGIGTQYVFNMSTKTLHAFEVYSESGRLFARVTPISNEIIDQFANYLNFYESSGNSWSGSGVINASLLASAGSLSTEEYIVAQAEPGPSIGSYDVVASTAARTKVSNYLLTDNSLMFKVAVFQTANTILQLVGSGSPIQVNYTVHFVEGSHATFTFNFDTLGWNYKNGTAVDASGNLIPESLAQVTGAQGTARRYDWYNQPDKQQFYEWAQH